MTLPWPVAKRVQTLITTRVGGVSQGPYASLNLGDHVGDDPQAVAINRSSLGVPRPTWLKQVHGTRVVQAADYAETPEADACITAESQRTCVVLSADCLPVLFADLEGRVVGAAHAGWRGLLHGVLEATVQEMRNAVPDARLAAYLGPSIGKNSYEVGKELMQAFVDNDPAAQSGFGASTKPGKYLLDLHHLAQQRLHRARIEYIFTDPRDTFVEANIFFSFRREARCGRMASMIWLS